MQQPIHGQYPQAWSITAGTGTNSMAVHYKSTGGQNGNIPAPDCTQRLWNKCGQ